MGGGKLYDGDTVIHQSGTYIATRLRPADDLSLILGARVSKYNYAYDLNYPATPRSNRSTDYKENGVVTPYAGMVYDLNDVHSVYTSWTSIFKPQSVRDAEGSTLKPREGDNYEIGLKSEFFGGRLNTSIAAYEIKQDNLAVLDEGKTVNNDGTTAAYKAVSGATTRGFEIEVNGELIADWNVSASYSHGITKDNDGERLNTEAPANMVKLWSTYRLPGDFDRLTIGGGANWQSEHPHYRHAKHRSWHGQGQAIAIHCGQPHGPLSAYRPALHDAERQQPVRQEVPQCVGHDILQRVLR